MSIKVFVFLSAFLMLLTSQIFSANYHNTHARIYIDTKAQYAEILNQHPDVVTYNGNYAEIVTNEDELAELTALGFRTEIIIDDIEKFVQSRFDKTRTMGGYLTLDEINSAIDVLIADHPDIVSAKVNIGSTIEGRPMWAIKVSDNPNVDEENEPEVLFTSAIHAREVITPLVLLNVLDSLTEKYPSDPFIQDLVNNHEIWFILNVNPDGYYLNQVIAPGGGGMWRKNLRDNGDGSFGVDVNRNYDAYWGYDDIGSSPVPDDETYRGTAPFSEPESQHMRDFSIAHQFEIVVYYHAYSNLVLWPWDYNLQTTPDEDIFIGLGDSVCTLNGYTPNYINPLYPVNGGTTDWHYGEQTLKNKSYSFVIEIGTPSDYFWPPTNRIVPLVNENYLSTLFLIDVSDSVEQAMIPKPPEITLADTVDHNSFMVQWTQNDDFNPAINYELIEYSGITEVTDPGNNFDNFINDGFTISYSRFHSGYSSFWSGMSASNFGGAIVTRYPMNFSAGDMISFWTYYNIEENVDYAYVAASPDGENWTTIEGNITTNDDPYGNNSIGNGITGASGGWVQAQFDMSAYAGQILYIAFAYITDESIQLEGFFIDDIEKVTILNNETVVSSSITDNFYNITGKPDGEYLFYQVRAQDADMQWSNLSVMRGTFATIPFTCGDVDGVAGINILDIVFLINNIYKGGPAPDPLQSADVNHDELINILDIVSLINFVYKGGADPSCS